MVRRRATVGQLEAEGLAVVSVDRDASVPGTGDRVDAQRGCGPGCGPAGPWCTRTTSSWSGPAWRSCSAARPFPHVRVLDGLQEGQLTRALEGEPVGTVIRKQ